MYSMEAGWSLLTNHALALVCVARQPGARLRDIAECVGITERAAHRIVCELEEAGYLTRHRAGRRNFYELHTSARLRHELLGDRTLGELLSGLVARGPSGGQRAA
jgi:DNA-binding MarR family transcriptional regulator